MTPYISQALELLENNNLSDSLTLMRQYAADHRRSSMLDDLSAIESSYRFLLKYLAEGSADPTREKLYCDLRARLYALIRNAGIEEDSKDSPDLYYSVMRSVNYSGMKFGDPLGRFLSADAALQLTPVYDDRQNVTEEARRLLNEKDRALKDIFSVVWTLGVDDRNQTEAIVNVASDADIAFELRGVIVGALTLSLLQVYDSRKLIALLDIESRTSDQRLRARALTGVVLALDRYAGRMQPDVRLDMRFDAWRDDLTNYPRLREVVYALVKTRGSERLMRRIQSEIMPGFAGIGQDFLNKFRNEKGEINLEDLQENPEWENLMKRSGIDKKLRKLHNMHERGADMMLPMFSQLSGHFFFKDADTWFRPFATWEAARLGLDANMTALLADMPESTPMCDTDKYALMLNLSRIPAASREMMTGAFRAGREEMSEEMKDLALHSSHPDFDFEALNYARVLYRFFNYFRLHKEFYNPFSHGLAFMRLPYLGDMLGEDEILHTVGESYFHQGFYTDAVEIYRRLAEKDPLDSAMLLQKIGYCFEKDGKYADALSNYLKADEASDADDLWLKERIYRMACHTGDDRARISSLEALLSINKDNLEYLRAWLELMLSKRIYDAPEEKVRLFEKRLAKLLYLTPDDQSAISLKGRSEWAKGNYGELLELIAPRVADIEMYLAASSLGGSAVEDNGKAGAESAESTERSMADDLMLAASAHAALGEYAEATSALKHLFMLKHGYQGKVVVEKMTELWKQSAALSQHLLMLPMLIEAARL